MILPSKNCHHCLYLCIVKICRPCRSLLKRRTGRPLLADFLYNLTGQQKCSPYFDFTLDRGIVKEYKGGQGGSHAYARRRTHARERTHANYFCLLFFCAFERNLSNRLPALSASKRNFSSCVISPSCNAFSSEVFVSLFLKKFRNANVI